MAKITLLFVEKLANSSLLPALPASIRKILSNFSFARCLCKGLGQNNELRRPMSFRIDSTPDEKEVAEVLLSGEMAGLNFSLQGLREAYV